MDRMSKMPKMNLKIKVICWQIYFAETLEFESTDVHDKDA